MWFDYKITNFFENWNELRNVVSQYGYSTLQRWLTQCSSEFKHATVNIIQVVLEIIFWQDSGHTEANASEFACYW